MKQRKTLISLLFGVSALVSAATTIADSNVKIHHQVTANQPGTISLFITIDNSSGQDWINATLEPAGIEFVTQESNQIISIGDLLANGQTNVEWTGYTSMSASYFQSEIPVFFHLIATNSLGESINMPVYSLGGAQ